MEIKLCNLEAFLETLYHEYEYGGMNPRTDALVERFFEDNGLGKLPRRLILIKDGPCEEAGYIAAIQNEDDEHYLYYCGHLHLCAAKKNTEAVIYDDEFLKRIGEMELL